MLSSLQKLLKIGNKKDVPEGGAKHMETSKTFSLSSQISNIIWGYVLRSFDPDAGEISPAETAFIYSTYHYAVYHILKGVGLENEVRSIFAPFAAFLMKANPNDPVFGIMQGAVDSTVNWMAEDGYDPSSADGARRILAMKYRVTGSHGAYQTMYGYEATDFECQFYMKNVKNIRLEVQDRIWHPVEQPRINPVVQKSAQRKDIKIGEYAGLIFVLAAVLFFIAVIVLQPPQKQQPKLQEPTTSTTPIELTLPQFPTASTTPKVEETKGRALTERPIPKNGAILKFPMETRVAPLSITTKGTGYYYFVLEKLGTDSACMSFFVHAGESIDLDVPLGAYKLYYATGTTWYGKYDMFGEDSVLKCCDDVLAFWEDQDGYSGWDITLYPVAGGNMDTSYVSEDEFPKP